VFEAGQQVEDNQETKITYKCCGLRMYSTSSINDTTIIDIFDSDFGKMKFDTNSFERLA
jgi:hypothetical protein